MNGGKTIASGQAILGIELGSTRIKACLVGDDPSNVLASGSHEWESEFVDGIWTYSLDQVWSGVQNAYLDLVADVTQRYGVRVCGFAAIGVSAMMHGYLPVDGAGDLLVPFRTWRNTTTGPAAANLTELFGRNIPLRWSIAHLHQAVMDAEPHISRIRFMTTLAGYVHWQLTGRQVLGVGDASGMFPVDPDTGEFDTDLLTRYDGLANGALGVPLRDLLPEVLVAGQHAGELTAAGAALLDPAGDLRPGAVLCPPEGDAGTGMVATNSVTPRTGNVSAGTSIFAMVVLERPLRHVHHEVDIVATPAGDPVAMVHCNNGASELSAWVGMFRRFCEAVGAPIDSDTAYSALFREALDGAVDGGGVLAFNYLAGEPITGMTEGRPLFVRTPGSPLNLANAMRAQLYSVFATLAIGMSVLADEDVDLDLMYAHGGMFRTAGVAQRFLAAALNVPVTVMDTAAEGGAWGMALLASYAISGPPMDLSRYLGDRVFAGFEVDTARPESEDVAGFAVYLNRYRAGLDVERAAVQSL